jgi:hypothetical protein
MGSTTKLAMALELSLLCLGFLDEDVRVGVA